MSVALSKTLRQIRELDPQILAIWCPGCDFAHAVHVGSGTGERWEWNKNVEAPTFRPSLLVQAGLTTGRAGNICHSFVVDGYIRFLADSTHALAGQVVPIPEWPLDVPEWALMRHG